MTDAVVGSLVYQFKADIDGLKAGLRDAQAQIKEMSAQVSTGAKQMQAGMEETTQSVRRLGIEGRLMASVIRSSIVGLLSGAFLQQIDQAVEGMRKLEESARALGTSRAALKEFDRSASFLGIDPKQLNSELVGLAQKIREAQIAGGDFSDKLKKIGIDIKSFDLSKPGEFARIFETIAQKITSSKNELDKLNALKFLGLSDEMLRVFERGGDAVKKFSAESQMAVVETTDEMKLKYEKFERTVSNVWKLIKDDGVKYLLELKSVVLEIAGALKAAFKDVADAWTNALRAIQTNQPHQTGGENARDVFARMRGQKSIGRLIPLTDAGIEGPKQEETDLSGFSEPKASRGGRSKIDSIDAYIAQLKQAQGIAKAEAENWMKGNVERAKAEALAKGIAIAEKEGKTLTESQRNAILSNAEATAKWKEQTEQLKEAQERIRDAAREMAETLTSSLDDLIVRGGKAKDVMEQLLKTIMSALLRGALLGDGMFGGLFGAAGGKGGANLGGLFGNVLSGFSGFFAEGGSIPSGKWGIAGENGPEMISGPAHVTPFGQMGGSSKTEVNIIGAPPGTKVRESNSNGGRRVDVVMNETVAAAMQSPQGAKALRNGFGARPSVARR